MLKRLFIVQIFDFVFLDDTFSPRNHGHLMSSKVSSSCKGIRVSVQYQVSVPISSDICTLVTRLLSLSFNNSIFIAI